MGTGREPPVFADALKHDPAFGVWADRPWARRNATACALNPRDAAACTQYAMGWNAWWLGGRLINAGHTGAQQKSRTAAYLYPAAGYAVYVLSNSETLDPNSAMEVLDSAARPQLPLDDAAGCFVPTAQCANASTAQ